MRINRLTVVIVGIVLLSLLPAYGQAWDEEARANAESVLQEKFQLEESLAFNQEGALDAETLQAFPASINVTDEGLAEGLTVALIRYGEETFLPLFLASLPELDPSYGFALMTEAGEALFVGPATVQGNKEGPESPAVELVGDREETYKVAFKFTEGTITIELPKTIS